MTADLERLLKLADRPGHMSVCHRGVDRVFSTAVVGTTKAVVVDPAELAARGEAARERDAQATAAWYVEQFGAVTEVAK